MTYYIFIEKYDGTQLKYFASTAKERDAVLKFQNVGIKFKAWTSSNGKKYNICDIAHLDRLFICPIRDCGICDMIYELRDLEVNLPIRMNDDDMRVYYTDIIKTSKEAQKFLTHFNSFIKNLKECRQ